MRPLQRYVDRNHLFGRHGFTALDWLCRSLIGDSFPVRGRALEIGAGEGLMSLWLLDSGASQVVSLEPEGAGATDGVGRQAAEHRAALDIAPGRWDYRAETLQAFADPGPFELILSHQSINHLDEEACTRIGDSAEARRRYHEIFTKIRGLLAPGGRFVVFDVGRANAWGALGLECPWARHIEWFKHQEPETWCALLGAAGLEADSRWFLPYYNTRWLDPILRRRVVARCLSSSFVIGARRGSSAAAAPA
jgi:SAM-dependent methyltransferase